MTELNNVKIYLKGEEGFPVPTVVYIPKGLTDTTSMPVLIWLPGRGEYANTGSLSEMKAYVNKEGQMPYYLEREGFKIDGKFFKPDFIIVMPLLPKDVTLINDVQEKYALFTKDKFKTETLGISGHSFGGQVVLWARANNPKLFKCFAPIAGNYELYKREIEPSGAMWIFHGAKDTTVWPNWSSWNAGYLEGNMYEIENVFKLNITKIQQLTSDVNLTFNNFSKQWEPLTPGNYPETTGLTLYAGTGHGSAWKTFHSAQYWGFLNYQFTKDGIVLPPVENPFEKMSNEELLLLYNINEFENLPAEYFSELYKRSDAVKEKYSL